MTAVPAPDRPPLPGTAPLPGLAPRSGVAAASGSPPLGRDDADQALAALAAAHDRIATQMYTIDTHPGLAYLKSTPVSGRTWEAWRDGPARVDALWAQFSALRDLLETARGVRARRSRPGDDELAELTRLLCDPVVALDAAGVPLDGAGVLADGGAGLPGGAAGLPHGAAGLSGGGAGLPGGAAGLPHGAAGLPAQVLRAGELAERMQARCAQMTALLDELDRAAAAVVGRAAPLAGALAEVQRLATELDAEQTAVAGSTAELARIRQQALADPLAAAEGDFAALDARLRGLATGIGAVRARLAELARVRDEFPQRMDLLRQAIGELAAAEAATGRSYAVAYAKIADPGLPPVPAEAAALRTRLPAAPPQPPGPGGLPGPGGWARLAGELAALREAVAAAHRRADQLRAAADGLLDRRAELRGRLEAYRAKAARLGYAEHSELSARHRQAKGLLYTSPCDLPAATRAVVDYQQALAELTGWPSGNGDQAPGERDRPSGEGDRAVDGRGWPPAGHDRLPDGREPER